MWCCFFSWNVWGLKMIIRPAQLLDIEKLSPLYAELGYPVKEAELVRRLKTVLSHPDYHLLVAVDDNEIIGMIGYAKMLFFENEGAYYHSYSGSITKLSP